MCNIIFFMIMAFVEVQTDWILGPGVLGPVNSWDAAFHQSDSMTYNIQGLVSPVATDVNPNAWVKHIIDQDTDIRNINSLVPGDFDNDGDLDLVGAKGGADIIVFYENLGDTFVQVSSFAAPGSHNAFISVNYINNDSLMDVVVSGGSGLSWFENSGGFTFVEHIIDPLTNCGFVETGDIDNDGNIDIATGGESIWGPIDIWKNDGSGSFTVAQTISDNAWRLRFDDLDGDGNLDLINAEYRATGGGTHIYFNDGTGFFTEVTSLANSGVDGMWSRDFDNDGDQDVLTGEFGSSDYLRWWENDGTGSDYTSHTVYNGSSSYGDGAFAEDMDMDGKADVLSGYKKLGYFKQITLDDFTEYVIDPALPYETHWLSPFHRGMCFSGLDVLVSCKGYFLWYENQMANQFTDSSWLESSVLNSNCPAEWLWFGYDVCCPFDSAISFQFRSGKDLSEITGKSWSTPPVFLPGLDYFADSVDLTPFTTNRDMLFQYKINSTTVALDAPIIYEVWVKWKCGGVGVEEELKVESEKLEVYPNPFIQWTEVRSQKPEARIEVYDMMGRLVEETKKNTIGENLPTGVYFVKVRGHKPTKIIKLK